MHSTTTLDVKFTHFDICFGFIHFFVDFNFTENHLVKPSTSKLYRVQYFDAPEEQRAVWRTDQSEKSKSNSSLEQVILVSFRMEPE